MRARFYVPGLGRFASSDSIVPSPINPQSYNRFSYVGNNPLHYVDPTGHCAGTPGEGKDDACWHAYFQAVGMLGDEFIFLNQWGLSDLTSLNGWLNRGILFHSNSIAVVDNWTSGNMHAVLKTLNMVETALGSITNAALGLSDRRYLQFVKTNLNSTDGKTLGKAYASIGKIELFLLEAFSWRNVETAIHEMAHIIDWNARPDGATSSWSRWGDTWRNTTGWQHHHEHDQWSHSNGIDIVRSPTMYARSAPGEDFADSFTWHVFSQNPDAPSYSKANNTQDKLDPGRESALTTALAEFR